MARVILPWLLRERAGGSGLVEVDGGTAREALLRLEARHTGLRGWVLDERGGIRPHVRLFVNDSPASLDTRMSPADELHIVPAISGG